MTLSIRHVFVFALLVIAIGAVVLWMQTDAWPWLTLTAAAAVGLVIVWLSGESSSSVRESEPEDISKLDAERRAELMRGTSKFLREMKYRYSVRLDRTDSAKRQCFSAEVNSVRLGFVPALVTDNTNDRQGYGYVAFVYDEDRWRGPGLPCPAGQAEAVQHAARCVSPLSTEEETSYFDG